MSRPGSCASRTRNAAPASDPTPPPMKYAFMSCLDPQFELSRRHCMARHWPELRWIKRNAREDHVELSDLLISAGMASFRDIIESRLDLRPYLGATHDARSPVSAAPWF